ncbi:uncharacterized protein LOC126773132 [Nymphalis io]|uniref:uncharacterized protein LOC126773132 n=1 Tax=Inachis io TaxID=171585 RepID=UPI002167C04C|nr:uncharacterized protein LOC126773132 [Nymphalis io]
MSASTESLLKSFCTYVYYAGNGNFWFENVHQESIGYKIYSLISFTIYITMILLENMAAVFGNFPEVEKKSAIMFSAIHDIIIIKMFSMFYYKNSIKMLNYEMSFVMKDIEEESIMKKQKRKVLWGITFYVITVYLSLTAYGVESLRKVFVEGTPFYTVVTYFPTYYEDSLAASVFRVFFYVTWLYMMLPMIAADCMPIIHVIIVTYKFMTLCHYFEKIRMNFERNLLVMSNKNATKILKEGCIEGIKIHQKLQFIVKEIHRVFGIIMSLQVCESSAVAVLLLLRLALSSHLNLTNAFMTYTFVGSLFFLLALNLWNAGEITYQASLLSNSMFFCGWHLCDMDKQSHKDIRRVVLVGCAQAQKPLILKAFGIQDLSYTTFVSVARMTYSIFAVFYQRRE